MNILTLATDGRTAACAESPELFAASALDYSPSDRAYAHLDLIGHAALAAHKAAAEEAAVDVCFGCALMMACEAADEQNSANPTSVFIPGVIGGRTEAERRARQSGRAPTAPKVTAVANPQIAPGDRGPRNQVDDELVATMTRAGKTSEQIARFIGCSTRTVSRARTRMGLNHATPSRNPLPSVPTEASAENSTPDFTSPDFTTPGAVTAATVARTAQAATNAPQHSVRPTQDHLTNPFNGGRPVSAAMSAIYDHLAAVGGSDTLDVLLNVGMPHVNPAEAVDWWTKHHSTMVEGQRVLRTSKANVPTDERLREGARAKVFNSLSATHRKGRYLHRDGDVWTFKPAAMSAWNTRVNAARTVTFA